MLCRTQGLLLFILDDLLAAPFKGVMWILKEVVAAAEEEQAAESDRIKDRLRELYMLLETGQMTEAEFEAEESTLLDRLDELEQSAGADDQEGQDDDDDADDDADDDTGGDNGGDNDDRSYAARGDRDGDRDDVSDDDRDDKRVADAPELAAPVLGVRAAPSAPADDAPAQRDGAAAKDRPGDGD